MNDSEAFWALSAPSTCIEWQGSFKNDGYGSVNWEGKSTTAHRVAYILTNGPIPAGLQVRHTCDNRKCCNPEHLILGTARDNGADRRERPKMWPWGAKGSAHGQAKLTEAQVVEIRQRYAQGEYQNALGRAFGVSQKAIFDIVHRETWTHVA